MGLRLSALKRDLGPGPKYPLEKMTRYGKANVPAYSIKSRQRPLSTFTGNVNEFS